MAQPKPVKRARVKVPASLPMTPAEPPSPSPDPIPSEALTTPFDSPPSETVTPPPAEPAPPTLQEPSPSPESLQPLPLKRRSRGEPLPESAPKLDADILALAGTLQDLIGRRREDESAPRGANSPQALRLRPRQPAAPTNPDEEVLAVLADARAATARQDHRFDHPNAEDRLEALAGRWLRAALWPGACLLVGVLAYVFGSQVTKTANGNTPAATPVVAPALGPTTVANPPAATVVATQRWSEKTLPALDEILAARRAGDPARAAALTRVLRSQEGALPGLELFGAENILHNNRDSEATTALLLLLRADPPVTGAAARLGFMSARSRRLDEAADYFKQACAADPFRGDLFARWGEALRRQGKASEAVTRFDQALLRPGDDEGSRPAPPDTAFRRRLARLEAGEIEPVRQETTAALAPSPAKPDNGRWLLSAAALELLDNHPGPAVAFLTRAKAALSPIEWDRLTNDLFFRNYAGRRELGDLFPAAGSPADVKRVTALVPLSDVDFIDP